MLFRSVVALGGKRSVFPFGHGKMHAIASITLFDSYHCSRYNTNTGRLTEAMFADVVAAARQILET